MSLISRSVSALGNLVVIGLLLLAFLAGMAGVVYMSLSGAEVKVPDIVGKDFIESEKELASLGLKIKKRADRASGDKINTVLEQLPKPGETVKTGQMILVVVSKIGASGEETPPSLKQDIEDDDTEKIEEMISDKPKKKSNSNSNTNKKKADTTRDVIANTSTTNSNDADAADDKKDAAGDDKTKTDADKGDKKDATPKATGTPVTTRPTTVKTPAGEPRSRPNRP